MANPYEIDTNELNKQQKENSMSSTGIFCPKRNNSIGGDCGVCDYIGTQIYAKKYPEGHPARAYAGQKKAKASIFANIVLSSDPDTVIVLEMGSQAAGDIIEGIEKKGWKDIIDPRAGQGRELQLTKSKGDYGFPKYSVSPDLEKAEWEVSKKALTSLYDLDQDKIIANIKGGEYNDTNENYLKASTLKIGETLKFRLCPPWESEERENNKRFLTWVWRHWGVTQAQIDGIEKMNWQEDIEVDTNTNGQTSMIPKEDEPPIIKQEPIVKKNPPCFGQARFFEADSDECQSCDVFKKCMQEVNRAIVDEDNIPF